MTQTCSSHFDRWDYAKPVRRPNALYALTPCGLGTPLIESLASYITRLAAAHVVSVWRLILHVLPSRTGRISRSTTRYAYPANGLGKISEPLLRALEDATQRRDLQMLTLSALEGCISQPGTFRTTEAWCPACLEQWRAAGAPLYSPLLWALQAATMCTIHKCPLVDRCRHCRSQFAPLRARALPGHCSICWKPLGDRDGHAITPSPDGLQYRLWSSAAIGQLLAASPTLEQSDLAAVLRENLCRCLTQTEGATRAHLAVSAGAAPCAFRGWVAGEIKPTLDHLSRLCYHLELPLTALFQGIPAEWQGRIQPLPDSQAQQQSAKANGAMERNELGEVLVRCLSEDPPPSVAEVSRRLKFRRPQTLWSREPDLCRRIAARRRNSGLTVAPATQLYPRSQRRHLEHILCGHLSEQFPPSLNEIAERLGYKSSGSIRERFPEFCRAIFSKRRQQGLQKKETMRLAIEAARAEVPPPTLKQIGHRLGYTCEVVIVHRFPEMCASYKEWRLVWVEQRRHRLRLAIREWVAAEAAPTVRSVCRHFGISPAYFQLNFPEDNKDLVRRSAERARTSRDDRGRALEDEVLQIVSDLRNRGIYPSLPCVRSELGPGSTRYSPLIRATINKVMSSFAPVMRQRDDLGRFV